MLSKHDAYDDDGDDDEEEGDFYPGMDDDDDLDDDFEDEADLGDDEDDPFLQGHLHCKEDGKIVFDGESFLLTSEGAAPSFALYEPTLEKPMVFSGTLKGVPLKMEVKIFRHDPSAAIDPLEQRFLDQQAQMQASSEAAGGRAKAGDDDEDEDDAKKAPASSLSGDNMKSAAGSSDIYVFEASQVGIDKDGTTRKIRGIFRPASKAATRLFLMAIIQLSQAMTTSSGGGATKPVAASAARKRGRGDDDDGDDGDDDVGYQELIDLHDDAGLSTEELRRRYYGGDAGESKSKKPKAVAVVDDEDDDDDDDAYGF